MAPQAEEVSLLLHQTQDPIQDKAIGSGAIADQDEDLLGQQAPPMKHQAKLAGNRLLHFVAQAADGQADMSYGVGDKMQGVDSTTNEDGAGIGEQRPTEADEALPGPLPGSGS